MSIKDLFNSEEREHLTYLGSMLSRPNTPFEQEVQDLLDAATAGEEGPEGEAAEQQKDIGAGGA